MGRIKSACYEVNVVSAIALTVTMIGKKKQIAALEL